LVIAPIIHCSLHDDPLSDGAERHQEHVAQAAAETAGPPDANGWLRVAIPIESLDQAAPDPALEPTLKCLSPLELRSRIAKTARQLTNLYGEMNTE
jgi:hypothetical protein